MATKTRTQITVERYQRTMIRSRRRPLVAWCGACAAFVKVLAPEQSAAVVGTTARDIYRRVEAGELHFTEMESGQLLVCLNSLRR